jgi:hypothetical protein
LTLSSSSPEICTIEKGLIYAKSLGNCSLKIASVGRDNVRGFSNYELLIPVTKKVNSIKHYLPSTSSVGSSHSTGAIATSGLKVTLESKSPLVCVVENQSLKMIATGNCSITLGAQEDSDFAASSLELSIPVRMGQQEIVFQDRSFAFAMSRKNFFLNSTSTSGLPVNAVTLTPSVCTSLGLTLTAKKPGECRIILQQPGNMNFFRAPNLEVTGFIAEDRSSITCTNGKKRLKVVAKNPKCPKGYKEK